MKSAVRGLGAQVEKFTYRNSSGSRTTHHLLCVSKHREGVALFKEISARESTSFDGNVPSLERNPAEDGLQPSLFSPIKDLEDGLMMVYAGRVMTMEEVYHGHSDIGRLTC